MLITTTLGLRDDSEFRRVDIVVDNDNEHTMAVEYYLGDELVHRSVHVHLKQGLTSAVIAASFSGDN